jgi:hypothetical protein
MRHGVSSRTQSKGKVRRWKPLPRNGYEDVAVDTSVCVFVCVKVNCKAQSRAVSKHAINRVANQKAVCSHRSTAIIRYC